MSIISHIFRGLILLGLLGVIQYEFSKNLLKNKATNAYKKESFSFTNYNEKLLSD